MPAAPAAGDGVSWDEDSSSAVSQTINVISFTPTRSLLLSRASALYRVHSLYFIN